MRDRPFPFRRGIATLPRMTAVADRSLQDDLERHRTELTRYCARVLGSPSDAEDAVQETLLRAWRGHGRFEGRSALRPWMYRIATNVCMTMLKGRARRAVPVDPETLGDIAPLYAGRDADPAEHAVTREGLRLALMAGVERLPPRQRAVLFLREVLDWRASEAAELLDTSTAAVNSALQRARATLEAGEGAPGATASAASDDPRLLAAYLAAFRAYA
jgi:RNA polymerase sigma-70 factor (ECF subfamily)